MALKDMQKMYRRQNTAGKDLALTKAIVWYCYGVFRSPRIDDLFKVVAYLHLKTQDGVINNC